MTPLPSILKVNNEPVPYEPDISTIVEDDPVSNQLICEGNNLELATVDDFTIVYTINGTDVSQPIFIINQGRTSMEFNYGSDERNFENGDVVDIRISFKDNLIFKIQGTVG